VPATVTWAGPASIPYGAALSGTQLNATANTPGTFVYSPPAGTVLNAGNGQALSVTFTPNDTANYSPATATVAINVLKAPLTITAQNKSKVYGAALPGLTAGYSGFVNGDTSASLDTPVSLSTAATSSSPVGNYPITAVGAVDANYTITHANGTLSVTRASLTLRADDKSRPVGQSNPPLTATYTGLVNGDTPASLDTAVVLSTAANQTSPVGTYPIVASGAADANYTITHVDGTLTVTSAFSAFVNFQPSSSPVPSGYLMDAGNGYANRGNGFTYGWNGNNTGFTRDRNSSLSLDQRYDTLNHMQKAGGARAWEIAVPNGSYQVFVVAGDASNYDSVFRINVEGVLTVSGTPTSSSRWVSGTKTVAVSDGRLTVSNASGSSNNKICFIDITSVAGGSPASVVPIALPGITLLGIDGAGVVTLRVEGEVGQTLAVEVSENLIDWAQVATLENTDGTTEFTDATASGQTRRFYRAVSVSKPPVRTQ